MDDRSGQAVLIAVFVVFLLAVVGGAYYLGAHRAQAPAAQNSGTQDLPEPQVTVTTTVQEASNSTRPGWKAYANNQYGFQLSYPSTITLQWDMQKVKAGVYNLAFFPGSNSIDTSGGGRLLGFIGLKENQQWVLAMRVLPIPLGFTHIYDYVSQEATRLNSSVEPGSRSGYTAKRSLIDGQEAATLDSFTGSAGTPGVTELYVIENGNLLVFAFQDHESEVPEGVTTYSELGSLGSQILHTLTLK